MNFFKKPTEKELMREGERELRSVNRNLASDKQQLEPLAKAGQREACTVLAKQLVRVRKQKTKNINLSATVSSTSTKNRQISSMNTMSKALGTSVTTMKTMNQQMPLDKFAQNMREFSEASSRMDMQSDIIEETLDSMLDVDEDEEDKVISQVLDEIGIEMNEKLSNARIVSNKLPSSAPEKSKNHNSDVDLEEMLANLRK